MKSPVTPGAITVFICLILVVSIAASTRGQASISVTGSVSDQNSAPIPDARVTLYSLDRILQTKSDSSGRFKFDAVPTGKYEFEVLAQGFARFTRPNVFVTDLGRPAIPDKPSDLTAIMQIAPTGSPREIIAVAEVAPTGSCGLSDSVSYG
ncbi:MAG TPA: carboxypeptidase-like regulatory domain-containing protein, partial [Pyrinomonadaceae bacterium]